MRVLLNAPLCSFFYDAKEFIYGFSLQRWKTRSRKCLSIFFYFIVGFFFFGWGLAEPPGRWEDTSGAAAESHRRKSRGPRSHCLSYGSQWQLWELSASVPPLSPRLALPALSGTCNSSWCSSRSGSEPWLFDTPNLGIY